MIMIVALIVSHYLGYSGIITSPFFGKPTTVGNMRKIDGGIGINF